MSRIRFSLFHGTSTVFLPSILAHGLAARNPVAATKGVECLTRLLRVADKHLPDQEAWRCERIGLEAMSLQRVTGASMNFRHGGTYCSPSEATAVRYALSNSHGSELLSSCASLYARLREIVPAEVSFLETDFQSIHSLALTPSAPILLQLQGVPAAALRTEQGGDAAERISIASSATGPVGAAILQQRNFELVLPISSVQFTVSRIVASKFSIFDLEYELVSCAGSAA